MTEDMIRKLLRVESIVNFQIKELSLMLSKEKGERITEGKAVQMAVEKLLEELKNK